MKNKKTFLAIGIMITIMCCIVVIFIFFIKTDSIQLTLMPVPDIEEQIEVFAELGYCEEGTVNEDYVEIELTKWQRMKWLKDLKIELENYLKEANEIKHMNIFVSSDTKELKVYADKKVNFQTLATYLGIIVWDIEIIQVLNGEIDWGFEYEAIDMQTERTLYHAYFPIEKMKLNESMWDDIEE